MARDKAFIEVNKINRSGGDAVYGLGLIGAAIYYIGHAHGFWPFILALLKALVWPTLLVYHLLQHLA